MLKCGIIANSGQARLCAASQKSSTKFVKFCTNLFPAGCEKPQLFHKFISQAFVKKEVVFTTTSYLSFGLELVRTYFLQQ